MNHLKSPDLKKFHFLKLYYKLYRNRLPPYFENFILHYGAHHQNLRNNHIRLLSIRCEFETIILNVKCTSDCAKYKINASQLTMSFVCRSKCICSLNHRLHSQWCSRKYLGTGAVQNISSEHRT